MKSTSNIGLSEVKAVYNGAEGNMWELLMGQQIHVGGLRASMDLAERAGIGGEVRGVDMCCCNGAGMRSLVRFRGVAGMTGVDASETVVARGRARCAEEGLADRISFVLADVCASGLPSASADFAWGEDAWCYVADKSTLIAEAARIVKPGGMIAFTDWVEGPSGLSQNEADQFLRFMKFPNLQDIDGYAQLLTRSGCTVMAAEDTRRFPEHVDLYMNMVEMQLTYDVMRMIGFDSSAMQEMAGNFAALRELAHAGKVTQARFIARKK